MVLRKIKEHFKKKKKKKIYKTEIKNDTPSVLERNYYPCKMFLWIERMLQNKWSLLDTFSVSISYMHTLISAEMYEMKYNR